jgi:hypothetical protein
MVALVEHCNRGPVGVHRTYLRPDGSGKAAVETAKASLGPIAGGAVQLAAIQPDCWTSDPSLMPEEKAPSSGPSCQHRRCIFAPASRRIFAPALTPGRSIKKLHQ